MVSKKVLLISILIFTTSFLFAQFPMGGGGGDQNKIFDGKISGTILDKEKQKPVEFANIALYKTGSEKPLDGTVSDDKGAFKLKNIKPGFYKVSITFIGYLNYDFD